MPDWTVRAPGAATDQNDQGADQAAPETSISQTPATPNEDPMVALAREAADYKDKLLRSLAEMENLRKRTEQIVSRLGLPPQTTRQIFHLDSPYREAIAGFLARMPRFYSALDGSGEVEMRAEAGEITQEERALLEADLLARIHQIKQRRSQAGGPIDFASHAGPVAVDASVAGDFHEPAARPGRPR